MARRITRSRMKAIQSKSSSAPHEQFQRELKEKEANKKQITRVMMRAELSGCYWKETHLAWYIYEDKV